MAYITILMSECVIMVNTYTLIFYLFIYLYAFMCYYKAKRACLHRRIKNIKIKLNFYCLIPFSFLSKKNNKTVFI